MNRTITYAQNREDLILSGFFDPAEDGFYVDVGANSPTADSVTKLFYDRGWHGINIEPIKGHFAQLQKLRPRDINLNIGVADQPGTLQLREYEGTGLSTFSPAMKQQYAQNPGVFTAHFDDYKVQTKTLAQVFADQKVTKISFLKVDVEGFEYEVLAGNDWQKYRPAVICIEANHVEKDWRPLLKQNNYQLAFFDGLNEYYVDQQQPEHLARFSYVEAVIFKEPIVSYLLLPELNEYESLQYRVAELEKELEIKARHIEHLENIIRSITPLRRHFKRQVRQKFVGLNARIVHALTSHKQYAPAKVVADDDPLAAAQQADAQNFANYNQATEPTAMLTFYLKCRNGVVHMANKLLRGRV
jgi:FkbM family methyltransferase